MSRLCSIIMNGLMVDNIYTFRIVGSSATYCYRFHLIYV